MTHRILSQLVPLTLGLATVFGATDAFADEERVFLYGGHPYNSSGQYVQTGEIFNDAPVYVKESGTSYHLYRRAHGQWVIDGNVDEDHAGTISLGPHAETPFDGSWQLAGRGALPTDEITVTNAVYLHASTLTFTGEIYNDAPVYAVDDGGYTFSMYRRADDRWVLDFNDVSEDWSGTISQSDVADWPWEAQFDNHELSVAAVSRVDVAECGYFSELNTGNYAFTGEVYNDAPVFQFESGEYTVSVYQRQDYRWYLDYNDISEDWDGTIDHAIDPSWWPWEATFFNGCEMEASEG